LNYARKRIRLYLLSRLCQIAGFIY